MKNLGSISDPKSTTTKEYVDNRVVANPQSAETPTELEKLTIGGSLFEPRKVIANPTLAGTEATLSGIQIGNTKYSMGSQSNIATVETGTTATKAYVAGEYVVVGGQLYMVTAAIASGGTFTPGTNVSATSVGDRLQNIETSVNALGIYSFTKTISYGSDNKFVLLVPTGSSHLIIVGCPSRYDYHYVGIVESYSTGTYSNHVVNIPIYAPTSSSYIYVTGTSGGHYPELTVTFDNTARDNPITLKVITLNGDRMTLST